MTKAEFYDYWNSKYTEAAPVSYLFRHYYPDRWFRIHNLPDSKRYAENDNERAIILDRQNEIIADLLGDNSFCFITGQYISQNGNDSHLWFKDSAFFSKMSFVELDTVDLHFYDSECEEETLYRPYVFSKQLWHNKSFDDILISIASGESVAFMLCMENNCIIAPYDGGMDIILENETLRDIYKAKYSDWLSYREDGL